MKGTWQQKVPLLKEIIMFWNILGVAIVIGFVVYSEMEWYISLPVGVVVAGIVVFIGGMIKGKIRNRFK